MPSLLLYKGPSLVPILQGSREAWSTVRSLCVSWHRGRGWSACGTTKLRVWSLFEQLVLLSPFGRGHDGCMDVCCDSTTVWSDAPLGRGRAESKEMLVVYPELAVDKQVKRCREGRHGDISVGAMA